MEVNKNNKRGSKAFTLIELLMVISVIALIAAMVFNSLRGARESARISNALSFQHQVHSLLGVDLVGWWNFDNEPVANQFRDISGGGNTGACSGLACPTSVDGVPGTRGTALRFDGNDDIISIPHSEPLNSQVFGTSDRFTISAWAHPISWADWAGIINKATDGSGGNVTNGLWANNNRGFDCIMGANVFSNLWGTFILISFRPSLNNWHHIVCSADGVTLRMFVDGRLVRSVSIASLTHSRSSNTVPITIGRRCAGCTPSFNGFIDDIRLYSRPLTASEIQTLYAQTKDKYLTEEK